MTYKIELAQAEFQALVALVNIAVKAAGAEAITQEVVNLKAAILSAAQVAKEEAGAA